MATVTRKGDTADVRPDWVAPRTQGWKGLPAVTTEQRRSGYPHSPLITPRKGGTSAFVLSVLRQSRYMSKSELERRSLSVGTTTSWPQLALQSGCCPRTPSHRILPAEAPQEVQHGGAA